MLTVHIKYGGEETVVEVEQFVRQEGRVTLYLGGDVDPINFVNTCVRRDFWVYGAGGFRENFTI